MLIKTMFAGFGGQGVLSMGRQLAQVAMIEGKYVTYLPSYGAEIRGGTANCTVVISDEEIASPVTSILDYVVTMNQSSMIRFQNQVASGGVLFVNSSPVEVCVSRGDIDIVSVPATTIAEDLKSLRSANMVMLGAFIVRTKLVSITNVIDSLERGKVQNRKLVAVNRTALMTGYDLGYPEVLT